MLFCTALLILEIVVNHEAEQALCLGAWSGSSLVFGVLAKLDILLQLGLVLVLDAEQLWLWVKALDQGSIPQVLFGVAAWDIHIESNELLRLRFSQVFHEPAVQFELHTLLEPSQIESVVMLSAEVYFVSNFHEEWIILELFALLVVNLHFKLLEVLKISNWTVIDHRLWLSLAMLSPLPSACFHLLLLIILLYSLVFLDSLSSTPLIELIDNFIFLLEQLVNPLFNFLFSPSFFKVD